MRETLVAGGQDVETVAPHFETRRGKRLWLERRSMGKGKGGKGEGEGERGKSEGGGVGGGSGVVGGG